MERRLIPDTPPAGYVPLSIAFDRFCKLHQTKRVVGQVETKDQWQVRLNSDAELHPNFLHYLRTGTLAAIVCHPTTREKMPIHSEAWETARYPERLLKADIITGQEGEAFRFYVGRTPFVLERQLSEILDARAKAPPFEPRRQRDLYPWDECKAEYLKRVAQDGAPTKLGGEPGWRTQADVERWIIDWMRKRTDKEPSVPTARRYAREFMRLVHRGSPGP
jgi:hypothetical protein